LFCQKPIVNAPQMVLLTLIEKLHGADLVPQPSVAMQVTAVVPSGKQSPECTTVPDAFVQTIVGEPPQLSLAVTVKETGAQVAGAQTLPVTVAEGQVIVGGVVSAKVMCCTQLSVLVHSSVAVHVRSMPALPVQFAAVAASEWVIVTVPPHASPSAVALPVLLGAVESPHASTLSAGQ
jgi:hypothetical protein